MEDHIKQPLMIGAIGCASTIMVYQFVYYFRLERGTSFTTLGVLMGVAIGLVVGGIAGGVAYAMMRNR